MLRLAGVGSLHSRGGATAAPWSGDIGTPGGLPGRERGRGSKDGRGRGIGDSLVGFRVVAAGDGIDVGRRAQVHVGSGGRVYLTVDGHLVVFHDLW